MPVSPAVTLAAAVARTPVARVPRVTVVCATVAADAPTCTSITTRLGRCPTARRQELPHRVVVAKQLVQLLRRRHRPVICHPTTATTIATVDATVRPRTRARGCTTCSRPRGGPLPTPRPTPRRHLAQPSLQLIVTPRGRVVTARRQVVQLWHTREPGRRAATQPRPCLGCPPEQDAQLHFLPLAAELPLKQRRTRGLLPLPHRQCTRLCVVQVLPQRANLAPQHLRLKHVHTRTHATWWHIVSSAGGSRTTGHTLAPRAPRHSHQCRLAGRCPGHVPASSPASRYPPRLVPASALRSPPTPVLSLPAAALPQPTPASTSAAAAARAGRVASSGSAGQGTSRVRCHHCCGQCGRASGRRLATLACAAPATVA